MLNSKIFVLFVTSLLQAVFWVALLFVDPFGMSSAADRASESIFLRLYPVLYEADWRDKVKIVVIDEEGLPIAPNQGLATGEWPLTFEEYTALIGRVLELEPKGVFVDILLDTENGRDPKVIEDFIASLGNNGPPVVFAAYGDPKKQLIKPLQDLGFTALASGRAFRGLVELTAPANHYPVKSKDGGLSPAAVLYVATLNDLNAASAGEYAALDSESADMLVAWGNTLPAGDAASPGCSPFTDDTDSRLQALQTAIVAGFSERPTDAATPSKWQILQPCAYHEEIAARDLFDPTDNGIRAREKIKGTYVFIGAAISGLGDVIDSPVHGQLPGVYLHAMALDNLLTFRGKYLETSTGAALVQFLLIFLCLFLGGLAFADRPTPRMRREALGSIAVRIIAWALFALMAAALLLFFLINLHLAPYNWGGVLAVAGVVFLNGVGEAVLTLVRGGPSQ